MRQTLRGLPPPRSAGLHRLNILQPTPSNPIVESWLESIHPSPSNTTHRTATTTPGYNPFYYATSQKPVPVSDELGLSPAVSDNEKRWRIARSALRATSFVVTPVVVIVIFTYREQELVLDPVWIPTTVLCLIAMLCNGVDLVVTAVRHGRGIPNKINAFFDGAISIGMAICVSLITIKIVELVRTKVYYGSNYRVAVGCLLTFVMLLHSVTFFSYSNFFPPSRRPREVPAPRLVLLPSGAAVMVTHRPMPKPSTLTRQSPVEMSRIGPRSRLSRATKSDRNQSPDSGMIPLAVSRSPPLATASSPVTIDPIRSEPGFEGLRVAKQGVPKRRPVATNSRVTPLAPELSMSPPQRAIFQLEPQNGIPPPAPDYQPDEAELRRAARGEAQAQWVPHYLKASN